MSITDNDVQQNTTQNTGAFQQQKQQTFQHQETDRTAPTSLNDMFTRSGRPEGGDIRTSEALQILQRVSTEAIKNQDLVNDFQILRFDRDQNRVGYSALLVTKQTPRDAQGNSTIVIRTLLMPNNGIKLPPRKTSVANGSFQDTLEVEPDVNDVYTAKYWSRVSDFARSTLGAQKATVLTAGTQAIPADFDLKEEVMLKQLLINSVNACDDVLARRNNETPFNVSILQGQDVTLSARLDFSGESSYDNVGNPVKADAKVLLNRTRKNGQQDNEFYEADSNINSVSLAINLEYSPQQQTTQVYGQPIQPQPPFRPAVIITKVEQAPWIKANTLELYMFGLSNAFRITANQQWIRSFLPKTGIAKDQRDVGALGWLSPLAAKIETKSETFSDADFVSLMTSMVRPEVAFMIDLNRLGDNSAIDSIFLDVLGGPNQQRATSVIIKAVNNLVGGGFERFFDHNQHPILVSYGSEIDLGHYWNGTEKRDRRDNDVLGALNSSEGNQQEWLSWYASQLNENLHPDLRRKSSKNFDRQYLGNVTYTGRAQRAVFHPKFIEGLDKAIVAAGVQVAMENVAQVFGAQRFQGNTMIHDYVVNSTAHVVNQHTGIGNFQQQYQGVSGGNSFY